MSDDDMALVERYYAQVLNGRDLDAVGDYCRRAPGRRSAPRLLSRTSKPSPTCTSPSTSSSPKATKSFFAGSTMTGTHDGEYKGIPPTGRHVAAEAAEVFRIANGKFVGYWCMTNVAGLMRQLTEELPVEAVPMATS